MYRMEFCWITSSLSVLFIWFCRKEERRTTVTTPLMEGFPSGRKVIRKERERCRNAHCTTHPHTKDTHTKYTRETWRKQRMERKKENWDFFCLLFRFRLTSHWCSFSYRWWRKKAETCWNIHSENGMHIPGTLFYYYFYSFQTMWFLYFSYFSRELV